MIFRNYKAVKGTLLILANLSLFCYDEYDFSDFYSYKNINFGRPGQILQCPFLPPSHNVLTFSLTNSKYIKMNRL